MKRNIFVNITLQPKIEPAVYKSFDAGLPSAEEAYTYPVLAYLEKILKTEDELKIVFIVTKGTSNDWKAAMNVFKNEFEQKCNKANCTFKYDTVAADFEEKPEIFEELTKAIIDKVDNGSQLIMDVTYGPKYIPFIEFTALEFAQKYLGCDVGNIIYGHCEFVNGKATNHKLCDFMPLFGLSQVLNTFDCPNPNKARKMLDTLLSL